MSAFATNQYGVPSDSEPERTYVVTEMSDGNWQCSCPGWKFHTPRRDCKHIAVARAGRAAMLDPLLALMVKTRHKELRRIAKLGLAQAA